MTTKERGAFSLPDQPTTRHSLLQGNDTLWDIIMRLTKANRRLRFYTACWMSATFYLLATEVWLA